MQDSSNCHLLALVLSALQEEADPRLILKNQFDISTSIKCPLQHTTGISQEKLKFFAIANELIKIATPDQIEKLTQWAASGKDLTIPTAEQLSDLVTKMVICEQREVTATDDTFIVTLDLAVCGVVSGVWFLDVLREVATITKKVGDSSFMKLQVIVSHCNVETFQRIVAATPGVVVAEVPKSDARQLGVAVDGKRTKFIDQILSIRLKSSLVRGFTGVKATSVTMTFSTDQDIHDYIEVLQQQWYIEELKSSTINGITQVSMRVRLGLCKYIQNLIMDIPGVDFIPLDQSDERLRATITTPTVSLRAVLHQISEPEKYLIKKIVTKGLQVVATVILPMSLLKSLTEALTRIPGTTIRTTNLDGSLTKIEKMIVYVPNTEVNTILGALIQIPDFGLQKVLAEGSDHTRMYFRCPSSYLLDIQKILGTHESKPAELTKH
jgi:hypothetical protein